MQLEQGMYFPTPIFQARLSAEEQAGLNPGLLAWIARMRAEDPEGSQKSNLGGWQSRAGIHADAEFQDLADYIHGVGRAIAKQYGVAPELDLIVKDAWANVNPRGASNAPHVHAGSAISGCYYLQVPDASAAIEFLDPRGAAVASRPFYPGHPQHPLTTPRQQMSVAPGLMVLFPGWLQHHVYPNPSHEERIGIAFNLSFEARG